MDIALISVLFFCVLAIDRFNKVSAAGEYSEVITEQEKVEALAVQHAKEVASWKNRLMRLTFTEKRNICNCIARAKVAFCILFLPNANLGYEFGKWDVDDFACESKIFHVENSGDEDVNNFQLKMYSCPRMLYRDLETNKENPIEEKLLVSVGPASTSAFIFFQREKNGRIYPQKYVINIAFDLLDSADVTNNKLVSEIEKPDVRRDPEELQFQLTEYLASIELRDPFAKFQLNFHSLNVCGLPRRHKIHVCRESEQANLVYDEPLQVDTYAEKCITRRIRIDGWQAENREKVSLSLLLCPRRHSPHLFRNDDFFYVGSNLRPRSLTLWRRENERGRKFLMTAIVDRLNTDTMAEDRLRTRLQPNPSEKQRQKALLRMRRNRLRDLERWIDARGSSVPSLTTVARQQLALKEANAQHPAPKARVMTEDQLVEDAVVEFTKIKSMKSVYERFARTYGSLEICGLPVALKRQLCEYIPGYLNESVGLHPYFGNEFKCTNVKLHLRNREVENLEAKTLLMWDCPRSSGFSNHFFVTKSYLTNTILTFRSASAYNHDKMYPYALILEIYDETQAQISLPDQ